MPCVRSWQGSGGRDYIMVLVVELAFMSLLGFVLGRVWEIRQQILRANLLGNRQRRADGPV